ncbi:hypothetical protein CWS35_37120 [Bradyrhizobium sp. SK17]|nr:hypothetical protein CWS35_00055 [Bradyrhizobium sp. SK17]AUC99246.1 hypothetical protein CWS35_37120 [Bradyrhizobium sp. SK17]
MQSDADDRVAGDPPGRSHRRRDAAQGDLEPFPFLWNRNGALGSCLDAFSSREPVSTSLENALRSLELKRPCPARDKAAFFLRG